MTPLTTRSVTGIALTWVVLVALAGCATPSSPQLGSDSLESKVAQVRDELAVALSGLAPQADAATVIEPDIAVDLRSLTDDEVRELGNPVIGFYELDQSEQEVSVGMLVETSTNSGGFTNETRYWLTCVRFEAVAGSETIDQTGVPCPESLLKTLYLEGVSQLSIADVH